jgi:predicted Zn-ribbon and HTH transcriptional regulator
VTIGPRHLAFYLTAGTVLTVFVIWLVWTLISRGVFTGATCPRCASRNIRRSVSAQSGDKLLKFLLIAPYRCKGCGLRHYNFRFLAVEDDGKGESNVANSQSSSA